jgi:hypothetical protein
MDQNKETTKTSSPRSFGSNSGADVRDETSSFSESNDNLKNSASGLYEHAKNTASESYDTMATKAKSSIEERKSDLSAGLKTMADSVRDVGGQMRTKGKQNQMTEVASRYSNKAAIALENVADYFQRKDLRAIMRDTEDFARRNPAIFLGGAFALGLLAARFVKSSTPRSGYRQMDIPASQHSLPAANDRPDGSVPRSM